ncbi:uncharacterized protein LOC103708260 isoform X2 [Phoenix dactylifera]|uniref:Uncharacterized protein LOC103708260 isoform X2 n=1 Tax=Phoenix dactylifera TaxID=42345 RepID=A0A8B9AU74_PHODC|nr:uncharacterized protein LOC103708260 isoform X2 [Phoenix dactylifera]
MDKEHSALGKQTPPSIGSPMNEKPDGISHKVNGYKSITPEVLQVPKTFKFPDRRYLSPTDLIISPVSKRLLARNQKVTTLSMQAENPFVEGDEKIQLKLKAVTCIQHLF